MRFSSCWGEGAPVPSRPWSPSGGSGHSSRWPPLSIDPALSQLPPYQGKSPLRAPAPAPLIFPCPAGVRGLEQPGEGEPGLGPWCRRRGMRDRYLGHDRSSVSLLLFSLCCCSRAGEGTTLYATAFCWQLFPLKFVH